MWRDRLSAALALPLGLMISQAFSHPLKLATWNLDWLTLPSQQEHDLPPDVTIRQDNDFVRLRAYADYLNADVIGFQEVDGTAPAEKVFDTTRYRLLLSPDPVVQRVGLAVRKNLSATINGTVAEFDDATLRNSAHHLRTGFDVTISDEHTSLRLLVVHLKTGCWDQPLNQRHHSCPILYRQFDVLKNWIAERQDEGLPYAVLGDFNRRLTWADPLMQDIESIAPMLLTTAGYASPCWGGESFIDHILLGNAAQQWLVHDSLHVLTYRNDTEQTGLSDHCPVSVMLDMP